MSLGDHHDARGISAGDLVADIDLLQTNPPVNRCGDAAPVELQLGTGHGGFVGFDGALRFADQRLLCVQLLAGDQIGFYQLLIAR